MTCPAAGRVATAWAGVDGFGRNSYIESMKAIVSEKGQVTIPKKLRDRLGIRPGQRLDFSEKSGCLVAVKASGQDSVDSVYGTVDLGASTDDLLVSLP